MSQLKMFATGLNEELKPTDPVKLARTTDPQTSKLAALEFVESGGLNAHEETIMWAAYRRKGRPWNVHEMETYIEKLTGVKNLDAVKIQKRLVGLERKGALTLCAERKCEHCNRRLQTWDVKK